MGFGSYWTDPDWIPVDIVHNSTSNCLGTWQSLQWSDAI